MTEMAPETVPKKTTDRIKHRVHRLCGVCVPDEPRCGDVAVCGAMILGERPHGNDLPCLPCAKAWKVHMRNHFGGRGE